MEWHKGARVVEYYQACSDNMIGTQVYCWITCGGLIGTNGGYAEVGAIRARDVSDLVAEVVEECREEVSRLFRAFFRGGGLLPGLGLCLRLWVSLRERLRRWQPERKGEHGDRNQPVRRGPPEHLHPPRAERESKTPARLADSALTDSVEVGTFDVFYDEDYFAGADKTQVLAGDGFDGGRVLVQPADFFAQARVVAPQRIDRSGDVAVLPPRAKRLEKALVAHERVGHQHDRGEDQYRVEDPPAPVGPSGRKTAAAHGLHGAFAPGNGPGVENLWHRAVLDVINVQ